ncbi:ankyrin repeat domain-containing protein [Gemmata sp. JC717]|uniref:ankyrin repeat domain-containing protein n=1 Tax=Gemmata algarum TaxID=2975278 RepID=UPI0021BB8E33|nr:ankyrin repeat domain-containing protein [Gemmata algarum]MDY3557299.1 ankyrin repeat domain-containing protein [Gemmata algarum]
MERSSDEVWRIVLAGSNWPPIWCAAALGDNDDIRRQLAAGADPNDVGDQDCTPLHVAAVYGRSEVVELLLAGGADPNRADPHGNGPLWTAMHHACMLDRTDSNLAVVRLLLAAGADPDHKNRYGRSPRDMAAQRSAFMLAVLAGSAPGAEPGAAPDTAR